MRAMVLTKRGGIETKPLALCDLPCPEPSADEILVRIDVCGVCRTDLHLVEGDISRGPMPIIPGHQVVGSVAKLGSNVSDVCVGDRVGVAWLHNTCKHCQYCVRGAENLCPDSLYTGYDVPGGFADYCVVPTAYAYRLPKVFSDAEAAPLLCAGIIGYRAIKRSNVAPKQRIALYGFGSSAHISIQILRHWGCEVFVVSRDEKHRTLALELGATWAGDAIKPLPRKVHSAIIFAPAGELVLHALENLLPGGTVATAGIHLSDIPQANYERHIFHEKTLTSVEANTRDDGRELLIIAAEIPIRPQVQLFPLEQANNALLQLKQDRIRGTAVLRV